MSSRLTSEEVVTIKTLAGKGMANRAIARALGITEGAIRYQLKQAPHRIDGRAQRSFEADCVANPIAHWMESANEDKRPANITDLHEHLVTYHDYKGSYRSVLRFVRANYPRPKLRTYRRVETPPGAQTQTDWGHFPRVTLGRCLDDLYAFIMTLSHSRKSAVIWSPRMDMLSWLDCHNRAYERLRGVAAVNRIDNLKTGISQGAGAWGKINPTYKTYARAVGFHVDPCPPRAGWTKGKVEAKVRLSRLRLTPGGPGYDGLEQLQEETDDKLLRFEHKAICPITGLTIYNSWLAELERLRPLPEKLPEPFDTVVERPVNKDATISFEGRTLVVPFAWVGRMVEVRGCACTVQIWADGRCLIVHQRHSQRRLLWEPDCYEGEDTDTHLAPTPLGKMGRRLQELMQMPVEQRPIDLYEALAEVAK